MEGSLWLRPPPVTSTRERHHGKGRVLDPGANRKNVGWAGNKERRCLLGSPGKKMRNRPPGNSVYNEIWVSAHTGEADVRCIP
jgi:hypothetical protein